MPSWSVKPPWATGKPKEEVGPKERHKLVEGGNAATGGASRRTPPPPEEGQCQAGALERCGLLSTDEGAALKEARAASEDGQAVEPSADVP